MVMRLRPGVVIAIEPMSPASGWAPSLRGECPQIADGTDDYTPDSDGWTLRTLSGARAARSEHTVAVTADGARILTS